MIHQQIPDLIQPLIGSYISLMNRDLPDLIGGLYLEGSIALGESNERFSDIDFVALLNRQVNTEEIELLRQIHRRIEKRNPRRKLSGNYLQWADLGHDKIEALSLPHYHDGILRTNEPFEPDPVTGWILKNHGIALTGPAPQALPFEVDWNRLRAKMHTNMNSYWARWTKHPGPILKKSKKLEYIQNWTIFILTV